MSLGLCVCFCQVECDMRNARWKLCVSTPSQQLEKELFFGRNKNQYFVFFFFVFKDFPFTLFFTMNETTIITTTTTIEWI